MTHPHDLPHFVYMLSVIAVHHKDFGVAEVCGTTVAESLVLSTYIPHGEADVL